MAYKSPKTKVTGFFTPAIEKAKEAGAKVIEGVSDAMSIIPRMKAARAMKQADQDVADIKMVREMKGLEDKGDYRDPLFRARANVAAMEAKAKLEKKKKVTAVPAATDSE